MEPDQKSLRRILCVGGMLHGRIVEIDDSARYLYVDAGLSLEVMDRHFEPPMDPDIWAIRATQKFDLYTPRRIYGMLVMVTGGASESARTEQTVDALSIAAGLGPLHKGP